MERCVLDKFRITDNRRKPERTVPLSSLSFPRFYQSHRPEFQLASDALEIGILGTAPLNLLRAAKEVPCRSPLVKLTSLFQGGFAASNRPDENKQQVLLSSHFILSVLVW